MSKDCTQTSDASQVTPANPAQVTDAMVEAAFNLSACASKEEMRAALTAAIGAGGQAVADKTDWPSDGTCIRCGAIPRHPQTGLCNTCADEDADFSDYDAGLLNDFGGGNVEWWQDYLRAEIGRANDFWRDQVSALSQPHPADERVVEAHNYETFRTFAHEATKAITNLTGGGSEYFGKEVDCVFLADLPRCVDRLRHRIDLAARLATEGRKNG